MGNLVIDKLWQMVEFVACNRPDLSTEALHGLECWLAVGATTITSLCREAPALFDGLCSLIASPGSASPSMAVASCGVVTRLAST